MVNEERHGPQGGEPDPRHPDVPAPGTSWGGEYDSEATAFVQLPEGLIGDPGPGDPLAAPGHGYRPPEIGTAAGPFPPGGPSTAQAAPTPAAGEWEMPFGTGELPPADPGFAADPAGAPQPPGGGADPGAAQSTAAALAGVHQGRARRRPLGEGPAEYGAPEPDPAHGAPVAPYPVADPPSGPAVDLGVDEVFPPERADAMIPPGGGAPAATGHLTAEDAAPPYPYDPHPAAADADPAAARGGADRPADGAATAFVPAPREGAGGEDAHPAGAPPAANQPGHAAPLPADGRPEPEHAAGAAPGTQPEPESEPAAAEEPGGTETAVTDTAAPAEESAAPPAPDGGADHHPAPEPPPLPDPTAPSGHPTVSYVLHVNGVDRPVTGAWIGESLLHVLRERLGLAGAKDGCSQGECGACSVQVDGRLVAACLVPAATAAGSEIRTVEGLGEHGAPSDVQRALSDCAVQCGFCLPGMAMTVHDLLEGNHQPSELETRRALCGNLCRCSGYRGVLDAVRQVVEERSAAETAHHEDGPTDGSVPRVPHQGGPAGEGGEA